MMQKLDAGPATLLLLLLGWIVFSPVSARSLSFHQEIHDAVVDYIKKRTAVHDASPRIRVGRLSPQLHLAPCDEPLEAFQPPGSRLLGNTTLGVRCIGTRPWTLYVPVQVQVFQAVAVAARPLARGEALRRDAIEMVKRDLGALKNGYVTDPESIIGMIAKRHIRTGTLLSPRLFQAPRLVRRGESVVILATGNGLEIRATGEALADGAKGDRIRVKNSRSKRIVEATVSAPGVVRVRTGSHFQ